VMARLLDIITQLAPHLQRDEDRAVLTHHAQLIGADAAQITNPADCERVQNQQREALRALMAAQSTASVEQSTASNGA